MKSLRNKLLKGGLGLTFIGFGYLIARICEIPNLEISRTIDISHVLTLIFSAWLALIITTVFEKQNSNYRVEKNLIIERIANLHNIIEALQASLNEGKIHISEASSSLKRITTSLNSIYNIIKSCHFDISEKVPDKSKESLAALREMMTHTPTVTDEHLAKLNSSDLPIEIKESMVYYNKNRISQIEVGFDSLKDLLLELQIEINRK